MSWLDKRYGWIPLLIGLVCGCAGNEYVRNACEGGSRTVSVRFHLSAGELGTGRNMTRSVCEVDEDAVRDVNVYAYMNGALAAEAWCGDYGGDNGLQMELQAGRSYEIFALANVGRVHAPADIEALRAMRIPLPRPQQTTPVSDAGHGQEAAVPMAYIPDGPVEVSSARTGMTLRMVRLMSRVNFLFDRSGMTHSGVEVAAVAVRQAASDVTPFSVGGKALAAVDGDRACEDDLATLNGQEGNSGGCSVSFYVPENCRGVLLPENEDHWAKVPERLPADERGLCTYLEVRCIYTSPGVVGENLVYRLFLGSDSVSDFSLRRNLDYTVTLSATDEGVFQTSWKVDLGEYDDSRQLCFDRDTLVVWQGGGAGTASILCDPAGVEHSLTVDEDAFRAAALVWTRRGNDLEVSSSFVGPQTKWARMFLRSWDGLQKDTLTVKLDYTPGVFMEYVNNAPRFCGQWGTLEFPTASADSPVTVDCLGRQLGAGGTSARSYSFRIPGSSGYMNLWYTPLTPTKVYMMVDDACALPEFTLSRGTLATVLQLPDTVYPEYYLRLSRPLSESGDINTDERDGFPYDADVDVLLADSQANILDLQSFALPEVLVEADREEDPDDYLDERYEDMCDRFIYRTQAVFSSGGNRAGFRVLRQGVEEAATGRLAHWQMWGLEADEDRPSTAVVRISNGAFGAGRMVSDIPVSVEPVFGQWRWLGEVTDWQLAPDSRRSSSSALGADRPRPNCGGSVSWLTRRGSFAAGRRPDETLWNTSESNYGVTFSPTMITYGDNDEDFLSHGGAFVVRGRTVNPHSGRLICGYYSFDSVLYLPIGAQVSLEGIGEMSTMIHYCFSPFTEMADCDWAGSWPGLESLVGISCLGWQPTGARTVHSYLTVPEDDDGSSYPLRFRSDVQRLDNSSTFSAINLLLSSFTQSYFTFDFEVDGRTFSSLDFTRDGYSSYYSGSALAAREEGAFGYYLLRRQADEATIPGGYAYGLENTLLEAWLRSYSAH